MASVPPYYEGWGLTMGFDGTGKPQFKFGSDDYFHTGGHIIKLPQKDGDVALEQDLSGKVDLSALGEYLPLSGGTLSGNIEAQNVYGNQFTSNSDC